LDHIAAEEWAEECLFDRVLVMAVVDACVFRCVVGVVFSTPLIDFVDDERVVASRFDAE